ncbi:hypothetical protein MMC25_003747 [Agyrium rufum]|nr:hypothetical protein [Agyrium rufum]
MYSLILSSALLLAVGDTLSIPAPLSPYAPKPALCPSSALVRPANGLSSAESAFITARAPIASKNLAAWLQKTNSGFATGGNMPNVAFTVSGGGYRSLLCGAGVTQGFDARDSNVGTSGLFQSFTYQAALSGGAWLLSSIAGNNYPTVSSLSSGLWQQAFQDSLLIPDDLLAAGAAYTAVTLDIKAKNTAGFPPTLTDPWGRLLSYQLLYGLDGGVTTTLSGVATSSNFALYAVPFPIITSLGVKVWEGECLPGPNATIYELTPYEFGSFDKGVAAFTQTRYLGSSLSNGAPTQAGICVSNYDNLGYVLGTSSNIFNEACLSVPDPLNSTSVLADDLAAILDAAHEVTTRDEYAVYPNPFYNYAPSTFVSAQKSLSLVDGGEALQNNPIFPLLQPARGVNVMIVNDNSADTSNNFPNGSQILTTYVQAQSGGLTRMPFIPSVDTFISEGLNKRPTFFGCDNANVITIVYLPNVNYTFMSNEPTSKLQYSKSETVGQCTSHPFLSSLRFCVFVIAGQ